MTIRTATEQDASILGDLFVDAVRTAGPRAYTPAQVDAWAAAADDREAFGRRMRLNHTFVAEDETGLTGFATLGADGHVGALYVRGDRQGRGIGRVLLETILMTAREEGLRRLYAEASALSRPLFEQAGFAVTRTETVERKGVEVERFHVERVDDGNR